MAQLNPIASWAFLAVVGLVLASLSAAASRFTRGWQQLQKWEHEERMKALEMGFYVPPRESPWPRAFVCTAIGVLVPLGTFACVWLASHNASSKTQGMAWGVAFLVSTTAVGCATSLAPGLPNSGDRVDQTVSTGKPPAFDPESFEVANGHR